MLYWLGLEAIHWYAVFGLEAIRGTRPSPVGSRPTLSCLAAYTCGRLYETPVLLGSLHEAAPQPSLPDRLPFIPLPPHAPRRTVGQRVRYIRPVSTSHIYLDTAGIPLGCQATSQAPGQQAPGQQAPGQQAPGQQAPGQQAPGQQAPGQESYTRPASARPPLVALVRFIRPPLSALFIR